jgi:hypothetical protein
LQKRGYADVWSGITPQPLFGWFWLDTIICSCYIPVTLALTIR